MFASFNSSFGMAGGSAIFGSLFPSKKLFIGTFVFPSQDSIQQDPCSVFSTLVTPSTQFQAFQFIGAF